MNEDEGDEDDKNMVIEMSTMMAGNDNRNQKLPSKIPDPNEGDAITGVRYKDSEDMSVSNDKDQMEH